MSGSLFPQPFREQLLQQILCEQTTFYNSASYCACFHYSLWYGRLRFAHCRDIHGVAPHGAVHVHAATQASISSSTVAHKRLAILTY